MGFGGKSRREELAADHEKFEELLDRLGSTLIEVRTAMSELSEATTKAERVTKDLNKACTRAEQTARAQLAGKRVTR